MLYENPIPCIVALATDSNGEILLLERGVEPHKGRRTLPMGFEKVEGIPEQVSCRKVKEQNDLDGRSQSDQKSEPKIVYLSRESSAK